MWRLLPPTEMETSVWNCIWTTKDCHLVRLKTADWDTYTKVTGKTNTLTAGKHILKVKFGSSYNNLDYVKFYAEGDTPPTPPPLPSAPTTTTTPSNTPIASGSYFSEDGGYFGPTCGSTDAENGYKGAYYEANTPARLLPI